MDESAQSNDMRDAERDPVTRVAELEAANAELEAFNARVAHDLKAPLISIAQFSQILLDRTHGPLNDEQSELLVRVRRATLQAKRLVDDLRDLADVSRRTISREDVDLTAIAHTVIEELEALGEGRDVTFEVQHGVRALADPALVRLLLVNLLENAWKYSSGQPSARIAFGVTPGPVRDVFYVRDDGVGFETRDGRRIFEPFVRVHAEDFAGTGLGLATAKRIVRKHGGDIWAEGEPGAGATFSFTL